jgi:hypothetical protein
MPTFLQELQSLIPDEDIDVSPENYKRMIAYRETEDSDSDLEDEPIHCIDGQARHYLDFYLFKMEAQKQTLVPFYEKLKALCEARMAHIKNPKDLSTTTLGLKAERENFKAVYGEVIYKMLVHFAQTYFIEKLLKQKGAKLENDFSLKTEGVFFCLKPNHTLIVAFTPEAKVMFCDYDLKKLSINRKKLVKGLALIHEWQDEPANPYTQMQMYRVEASAERIHELMNQLSVQKNGLPWRGYTAENVPSERTCHGFVYEIARLVYDDKKLEATASHNGIFSLQSTNILPAASPPKQTSASSPPLKK